MTFKTRAKQNEHIDSRHDKEHNSVFQILYWCDELLRGRSRDDEFQGVIQCYRRQPPHAMLPVTKHREGVAVLFSSTKVRVATVLRVAQVGQWEGEDLLHLEHKGRKEVALSRIISSGLCFLILCAVGIQESGGNFTSAFRWQEDCDMKMVNTSSFIQDNITKALAKLRCAITYLICICGPAMVYVTFSTSARLEHHKHVATIQGTQSLHKETR